LFLVQQFSANVAPLISRSKYIKPLLCQVVFVFATAVLSERRTAGFPLQIHKAPALSGIFILGKTGLSERRTADIPIRAH